MIKQRTSANFIKYQICKLEAGITLNRTNRSQIGDEDKICFQCEQKNLLVLCKNQKNRRMCRIVAINIQMVLILTHSIYLCHIYWLYSGRRTVSTYLKAKRLIVGQIYLMATLCGWGWSSFQVKTRLAPPDVYSILRL